MKNIRIITIALITIFTSCLPAIAQYSDTWVLKKVEVTNRLNKWSTVTREQYNENGGSVDLSVDGNWESACPGGREVIRLNWTFPQGVTRISDKANVAFDANIASLSKGCSGGIAEYTGIYITGSSGVTAALSDERMRSVDVDRIWALKDGGTRAAGNITPRTGAGSIQVGHTRPYYPDRPMAYFAIWIHPRVGGDLIYVYEYERAGQSTGGGYNPGVSLPRYIRECEAYSGTICGNWALNGNQFDARWDNGAAATLTIERFDSTAVILNRRDANSDFTARYVGRMSGNKIENGTVTWTSRGQSWSGKWSASW